MIKLEDLFTDESFELMKGLQEQLWEDGKSKQAEVVGGFYRLGLIERFNHNTEIFQVCGGEKVTEDEAWEEVEKRMNVIGQNGNDGEHYGEPANSVTSTLKQRGERYGQFKDHAKLSQGLKDVMKQHPKFAELDPDMKEALEMIQHKIARIINGDPGYDDSWHDLEGYASLVKRRLNGEVV